MKKYTIILLNCLINLSIYAQNKNDHKIDSLNQIIENTNNDSLKIQALLSLESMYFNSNPNKCLELNQNLQEYYKTINLTELDSIHVRFFKMSYAKSMSNSGALLVYRSKYDDALKLFEESNEIVNYYNEVKEKVTNLIRIGILHYYTEEYETSISYLLEGEQIAKEYEYKEILAQIYANLGNVFKSYSDYQTALIYYKMSLDMSHEIKSDYGIALNLSNIGVVYRILGDYPRSLDNHLKSKQIREKINDNRGIIHSLGNLVNIYMTYGNYQKCIEISDTLIRRNIEVKDMKSLISTHINLGLVYEKLNDFEKAQENYEIALELALETKNKNSEARAYNNLAILYKKNKDYNLALEYYRKSILLKNEVKDLKGLCTSYINMGSIYLELNQLDSSIFYIQKSLALSTEINAYHSKKKSLDYMSVIYFKKFELDKAELYLLELLNMNQREIINNFHLLTDREKELFYLEMKDFFELFYSFSFKRKDSNPSITEKVYNTILKNKGILLKSSTALRNVILSSEDEDLKKLYKEWLKKQKKISQSIENGENIDKLSFETDSIERVLIKKSNLFNEFNSTFEITWKDIQNGLKTNETAIEFIHFTDITDSLSRTLYCAVMVRKDSKHPEMVELFYENELIEILNSAKGNSIYSVNKLYGNKKKPNNQLYNLIWLPMEDYLKGSKKIYISPSGLLHKISFSAMANENNIYLCEMFSINLLTSSTNIIKSNTFQIDNNSEIGVFGGIDYKSDASGNQIWPYLEGSLVETEKINQLFQNKKYKTFYRNKSNATESEFKKITQNVQILHVATHGFFYPNPEFISQTYIDITDENEDELVFRGNTNSRAFQYFVRNENPLMRSGIVFADANKIWDIQEDYEHEDGVLTAQEVLSLDLRNIELIVLSACETGLGDIRENEGVYGLQRSLKMAGVKYIIMSLWQVPDKETAEFMISFYQQLIKTKNIHQSFTFTQNQMRKKYDPYYWAAFVLME